VIVFVFSNLWMEGIRPLAAADKLYDL